MNPFLPAEIVGGGVVGNDATGSAPERVVENTTGRTPQIGDKLFKNNNKGFVIKKTDTTKDSASGWTLLGYIYKVEGDIIKVVSKDTGAASWALKAATVYDSIKSGSLVTPRLSEKLSNVTDGYTAWRTVGGKLKIKGSDVVNEDDESIVNGLSDVHNAWNPDAIFRNYDAISWALCYPKSFSACGIDNNKNCFAKEVVTVVSGNTVDSRWYLPSVKELKDIYSAGTALANWSTHLKDQKFWSVEVNTYTGNYDAAKEKLAKYVDFADAGQDKTADKLQQFKALSVAQFNYKNM